MYEEVRSMSVRKKVNVVEVFCVDTSRSMWYSQTFPYVVGKSKLVITKEIIAKTVQDPSVEVEEHYSSLVVFSSVPEQVVPFERHDAAHLKKIIDTLDKTPHRVGTAIYSAIKYCEKLICEFISRQRNKWNVLLHVFSDGEDNASDEFRKKEFQEEKEIISDGSGVVKHSFLYSFNTDFQAAKNFGMEIGASVIMVNADNIEKNIEERDKIVFRANREKSQAIEGAFNLNKGDTPDIKQLFKQLQKWDTVFRDEFIREEGIFRENASYKAVAQGENNVINKKDTLQDYLDPITASHTLKNVGRKFELIPKEYQNQMYQIMTTEKSDSTKITKFRVVLDKIHETNYACLKITVGILERTVREQKQYTPKAISAEGLGRVFSSILFPDLAAAVENENTVELKKRLDWTAKLVEFLIVNKLKIFK